MELRSHGSSAIDSASTDGAQLKKRSSLAATPSARTSSTPDHSSLRDQHNRLPSDDFDDTTSASSGDISTMPPVFAATSAAARDPLPRVHAPNDSDGDESDAIAFHTDAAWTSSSGGNTNAGNAGNAPIWTHLFGCVRRCLSASSQPGFFDVNDPSRRKHSGVSHLPYRYRSLLLLNEQDDGSSSGDGYRFDAVLGLDSANNAASDDARASRDASSSSSRFVDKEHMTELTVSLLESTWVFLLLLGILASTVAWSVDWCVLLVQRLRGDFVALGGVWLSDYLLYTTYRVVILLLGVACTFFVCPSAAGSGIPEMRSIIGGFPFPNYLSKRTLVAKSLGLIFALGSGLSIGKEGPFVHLSCVIAHQLLRVPLFEQIRRSQDLTHHVLAAACAVGVTATFGTPIGGVLFSIEVTTTYYVTSNYWRAFFSSVVAVVVFRTLNSLLTGNNVSLFTTDFEVLPYKSHEISLFLLLAALCGVLGALFVKTYRAIGQFKTRTMETHVFARWPAARAFAPFVYAAFVALVFALVEFPVGHFMQLSQRQLIDDMFSTGNLTSTDTTHLQQDFGQLWTSPSLALNLFAYICVRFISSAISATVMVPSGIVTPVFAVGAAIGRLFGEMIVFFGGGHELAGGYAVVGAASLTAGVTGTISIAVIVFELTSQLSYMVPVLLSVLVGRAVAAFFSLDMYDTISREKNLPQWPDLTKQRSYGLTASDLMRGVPAYWVLRHQSLASLKRLLLTTPKDVTLFPVVDDARTMVYLGAADREELECVVELWELSLSASGGGTSGGAKSSLGRDVLAGLAAKRSGYDTSGSEDTTTNEPIATPRTRHIAMANELALAGLSRAQAAALASPESNDSEPVDLVRLELLNLDAGKFHVHRDAFASQVILLISVHKAPELFVTARGKLLGVIHASDLLARSRRFML